MAINNIRLSKEKVIPKDKDPFCVYVLQHPLQILLECYFDVRDFDVREVSNYSAPSSRQLHSTVG